MDQFSQQLAFSAPTFIRGRSWLVNNPRGKLLNQSDRSSYFTQKSAGGHATFLFWKMVIVRNDFRHKKVTFFGKTWTINSKKLQVKNCQVKEDFSSKWPALVSFLTVSSSSCQSKFFVWNFGYVLVCLSLAYNHNKKRIWKSKGGKVILTLCDE